MSPHDHTPGEVLPATVQNPEPLDADDVLEGEVLEGYVLDEPLLPDLLGQAVHLPPERNPVSSYLGRLSEGSRRTMRSALEEIAWISSGGTLPAHEFPWWLLRVHHTERIRAALINGDGRPTNGHKKAPGHALGRAPATVNRMLSALKGVFKASWRLGLMTAEERDRASDVPPARGERMPPGRDVERGELRVLFEACFADARDERLRARGFRDAAALALLYVCGLRRAELAALKLGAYDPETRTLRVLGKGDKEAPAYAEGGAAELLDRWLEVRGPGGPEDPIFLPIRKDGKVMHTDPQGEKKASLSDQAVYNLVKRRHREAGIKEVSPHDLRRTFVGDLLDAVGDLSKAQKLARHSDPATTARYDRRGARALREAASHLRVPHFDG